MSRRRLLACSPLVLLALAPAARAAELTIGVDEGDRGIHWGESHAVRGTLTSDGRTPLAGQQVVLQVQAVPVRRPVRAGSRPPRRAADGTFSFETELTRNTKLRAVAPAAGRPQQAGHRAPVPGDAA